MAPPDEAGGRTLSDALGITPLTAQVLINRGLADPASAAAFLTPRLDTLRDPFQIIDMAQAVNRLVRAIREQTLVVIYGDYDADGVTATAIMVRGLRGLGARVDFYVPDRRTEGYGLHAAAVNALARDGAGLLVSVDCGVTAVAAAEAARAAGVDLIIVDHHEPLGPLPRAVAVVDPKRQRPALGADYCAAGLAYQCCRGLYAAIGVRDLPDELIGLAALGTVADAVKLADDNRTIVALGMRRLDRPGILGADALAAVAAAHPPLRVRDLSHGLAPRVNAAGRLAHAASAVRLLITDDAGEAADLAGTLDRLNQERRALCDMVLDEAVQEIERAGLHQKPAIVLARSGWHPGVIGIVASQVVERYYRPTVLIALDDGIGRGSARSIRPLPLVDALGAVASDLVAYGGHAMAAGLTLDADAVPRFTEAFVGEVGRRLRPEDLQPAVAVDAEIGLESVTPQLAVDLERIAPCGQGNPEAVFLTRGLRALGTRLVGDGTHLRLIVGQGPHSAEAIAFRSGDQVELLAFTQARIDLAYTVEIDRWRDKERLQLVAVELETPDVDLTAVSADAGAVLDRLFARADDYLGPRLREVEQAPAFHTKVVGVTFEGRQAILPTVRAGERLTLAREPHNPHDPHAIKVVLSDGRQIGFLSAGLAARLAPSIDGGARYAATAASLTGGGDRAWGLNIFLEREAPWAGEETGARDRTRRTAGSDLVSRFASGLHRGRSPSPAQRQVADAMLAGDHVVALLRPGRGLLPAAVMGAVALLARGARPAAVVLPRACDVDAWYDLAAPWMREVGIRAAGAHGLLGPSAAARLARAFERGAIDVLFASAAWIERHGPAIGGVIAVLDALATEADLTTLGARYGRGIGMVAGPMTPELVKGAQRHLEIERVIVDPRTRDNLRIVDRRDRPGTEVAPGAGSPRPEKTLIVAAAPDECVTVARRLRERHPEAVAHLAYHHAGLPAPLRRVLEDLFAAGRFTTLVSGSHLVDPAVPPDITRVAAVGLRSDRLLMVDSLAAAGGGRRQAVIELCYGAEAIAASHAAIDARCPSRELLARCYRALRTSSGGRPWTWPDDGPADRPEFGLPAGAFGASLEILIEAGVVAREAAGASATQYTFAEGDGKFDLTRSLRYRECERERAAWADLRAWATGPAARILADLAGA